MMMYGIERTHLVGGHRERINIAFLRGVAIREAELCWVEQFWSHITNNAWFGCCRTTWLYDCGIGYDTGDPEVPQACDTIISDQDVSLDRMNIGARIELGMCSALTGFISLWTMLNECRYSRPQAAWASYEDRSQTVLSIQIVEIAH